MTIEQFWDSSLMDIIDTIESFNRRRKSEIKDLFIHADALATRIGLMLSGDGKVKVLQPWDIFPEAFAEERVEVEAKIQKAEQEELLAKRRSHRRE